MTSIQDIYSKLKLWLNPTHGWQMTLYPCDQYDILYENEKKGDDAYLGSISIFRNFGTPFYNRDTHRDIHPYRLFITIRVTRNKHGICYWWTNETDESIEIKYNDITSHINGFLYGTNNLNCCIKISSKFHPVAWVVYKPFNYIKELLNGVHDEKYWY